MYFLKLLIFTILTIALKLEAKTDWVFIIYSIDIENTYKDYDLAQDVWQAIIQNDSFAGDKSVLIDDNKNTVFDRIHSLTHPEDTKYADYGKMVGNKIYQTYYENHVTPVIEDIFSRAKLALRTGELLDEDFAESLLNTLGKMRNHVAKLSRANKSKHFGKIRKAGKKMRDEICEDDPSWFPWYELIKGKVEAKIIVENSVSKIIFLPYEDWDYMEKNTYYIFNQTNKTLSCYHSVNSIKDIKNIILPHIVFLLSDGIKDKKEVFVHLAKILWHMANSSTYRLGQAGITQWLLKGLAKQNGYIWQWHKENAFGLPDDQMALSEFNMDIFVQNCENFERMTLEKDD